MSSKRRAEKTLLMFFVSVLFAASVSAQGANVSLKSIVVDPFDGAGTGTHFDGLPIVWRPTGSSYTLEGYPRETYVPNTWPLDLFGAYPPNADELQVYGVQGSFQRPEINQVYLTPGTGEGDNWEAKEISLPGFVKSIDLWVWGSNLPYTIQVDLRDAYGTVTRHFLYRPGFENTPGTLDYLGWQDLYLSVGSSVFQVNGTSGTTLTSDNRLRIVKFIITTPIGVPVNNFYFYFDQLRVLTDTRFDKFYDGYELGTIDKIVEVWGSDIPGQDAPAVLPAKTDATGQPTATAGGGAAPAAPAQPPAGQ